MSRSAAATIILLLLATAHLVARRPNETQESPSPERAPRNVEKRVAITFDDLPLQSARQGLQLQQEVNDKLLDVIAEFRIPVVGFVNESKLLTDGVLDKGKVEVLRGWIEAGLELGNHTHGHADLHHVSVRDFQREILDGERVIRGLASERGVDLRWFRHPYLHTGRSLEVRDAVGSFLSERGYRVAPVTIDNSEWIFARAYDHVIERGDESAAKLIGESYIAYMDDVVAYYEDQSAKLFKRQIRQVLLLHVNQLNAARFTDIARNLLKRGYDFISLDRALEDPAYGSRDEYTGPGGITWIHRWAMTRGTSPETFSGEPAPPRFVQQEAGLADPPATASPVR